MYPATAFLAALGALLVITHPCDTRAQEPITQEALMNRLQSVNYIDFEDIVPADGYLMKRARYTYDMYKAYTPEHVLTLNYSTTPSDKAFPGDTIGRYILSTTLLSRALHEAEPETLSRVMAALPGMVNAEGYLGWVLPKDRADETGLSNIMWSNGLTEYCLWKKDPAALKMDENLFTRIILPVREAYDYYYAPEKSDGKITWVHCTCDTAQAFGIIDPATRGYQVVPSPELKQEINDLIRLYHKVDPEKIQAQVHAVLFATRGILRWAETEPNAETLAFGESLYRRYRQGAMTENYENYNWFGKPKWTEGCAIVDSFTDAARLWKLTGRNEYLADAQLILFNALLANQKDGDFGINNCVGANGEIFLKHGKAAPWCCSVWGGKGLARAFQYSYFRIRDGVAVTIPGNSTATVRLPDGALTLQQSTGYPHEDGIRFRVQSNESDQERTLAVFMPPWIEHASVAVTVNGAALSCPIEDGFLLIKRPMKAGDEIDVQFAQRCGAAPLLRPDLMPGFHRFMRGALVLGVDSASEVKLGRDAHLEPSGLGCCKAGGVTLAPLCDLMDLRNAEKRAKSGSVQVVFAD